MCLRSIGLFSIDVTFIFSAFVLQIRDYGATPFGAAGSERLKRVTISFSLTVLIFHYGQNGVWKYLRWADIGLLMVDVKLRRLIYLSMIL